MSETTEPDDAGRKITVTEARDMIDTYASQCGPDDLRSLTISASYLRKIVDQPDCQYVTFYLAVNSPDTQVTPLGPGHSLVVVGVGSDSSTLLTNDGNDEIYEDLKACPPDCNITRTF